ncbi:hypothetical protein, partial [Pseudomonas syringae]|uniref:hypothetical protein n=1 Tax=Pseudomonas syringae TaxID=317 RepID=UPI00195916FC
MTPGASNFVFRLMVYHQIEHANPLFAAATGLVVHLIYLNPYAPTALGSVRKVAALGDASLKT